MKRNNLPLFVMVLVLLLGACKKDNPTNNSQNNPLGDNAPSLPSGAAGAMYAVLTNTMVQGITIPSSIPLAWFGNDASTQNAGVVLCDQDTMVTTDPFSNVTYPWYELSNSAFINTGNQPDFTQGNTVQWFVSGSSSVPAINYNDTTTWPQVTNFTLPSSISISTALTISFGVTGTYKQIICSIKGTKSSLSQNLSSGTSVTFSASQLSSVTTSTGGLAVEIMPVNYTPQTYGGKTYYFVKQNAFVQSANTTQ
jgi:hypothetical protein